MKTTIPKNYSGFKSDIDISKLIQTSCGLYVITGKNGSGKTQILNFINDEIKKNIKILLLLFLEQLLI